ncbi:sensor histidine kinase [Humibacter ginsenosidimutans]|uniref:ATP-binding protein n=1 Tax=Humibacter ginsenosidimutans TaxID=2599293 RepID=A0A5B8M604_9MICO|nr:ATP-binding protein [Humibacter ginsenosidimutans]QDZ14910.1 ATP-binding protein [Humibacter ginsenosidimutans]
MSSTGAPEVSVLRDLARVPELRALLIRHAARGFRVQSVVRTVLVVFLALTVLIVPPPAGALACLLVVAGYAVWAVFVFAVVRGDAARVLRFSWLALYGDVLAVAVIVAVASLSDDRSSTAGILLDGMFLLPVVAAVQLRVWAAVSVIVPTIVVFVVCSVLAVQTSGQLWAIVPLRSLALAGVGLGCVLLVRLQASRVLALGREYTRRGALLSELLVTESRERATLSEHLHDGALQYVLAARQELDDLPAETDPAVAERLRGALGEASVLLRSQVAELSPAVLQQAGLAVAVRRLAVDTAARGRLDVQVDESGWSDTVGTATEQLLYDSAREFLGNVVKHAHASHATVTLARDETQAVLAVTDDGVGADPEELAARLGAGHIGLATRRIRLEAAGGRLDLEAGTAGGTVLRAVLPVAR